MPVFDLPTQEGWKAEFTWMVGYVMYIPQCQYIIKHKSNNVSKNQVQQKHQAVSNSKIMITCECQSTQRQGISRTVPL